MKVQYWLAIIMLIIAGTIDFVGIQAQDPNFMSYILPSLFEFHFQYIAAGALAAILLVGLTKVLKLKI